MTSDRCVFVLLQIGLAGQVEDVMQWLLTPTNVKRGGDISESHGYNSTPNHKLVESHVTEWLLQHHSGAVTGTAGTNCSY